MTICIDLCTYRLHCISQQSDCRHYLLSLRGRHETWELHKLYTGSVVESYFYSV